MKKAYALAAGEGRSYVWHDVLFTMKAAQAETGGAFALWDVTTRPGEEPHMHVHDDVDEIFYVLSGSITFRAGQTLLQDGEGRLRLHPPWHAAHLQDPQPHGATDRHQHALRIW